MEGTEAGAAAERVEKDDEDDDDVSKEDDATAPPEDSAPYSGATFATAVTLVFIDAFAATMRVRDMGLQYWSSSASHAAPSSSPLWALQSASSASLPPSLPPSVCRAA